MDYQKTTSKELINEINRLKEENARLKSFSYNKNAKEESVEYLTGQNNKRYNSLFDQNNDAVFFLSLEGNYLEGNKRAAEMLGYTETEIRKLSTDDVIAEKDKSREIFKKLLSGKKIKPYERRLYKKDGRLISVAINVELIKDESGKPSCIQCIVRDITKTKTRFNATPTDR